MPDLTQQQSTFVTKYVAPTAGPPGSDALDWLYSLGKARLELQPLRTEAQARIARLKDTVRQAYLPFPDLAPRVEAGLGNLDIVLDMLGDTLGDALDDVLNAADAPARKGPAEAALATVASLIGFADSNPIARTIDANGLDNGIQIVGPMRGALENIQTALSRI